MRRMWTTVALTLGALCVAPAVSQAATITLTDDAGAPVPLVNGLQVRNMAPALGIALTSSEKGYAIGVTGPNGASLTSSTCSTLPSRPIDYVGNGAYTVAITTYSDTSCRNNAAPSTVAFSIAASVAVTVPPGIALTRRPGDVVPISYNLPFAGNPGANIYQGYLAKGTVLGADGLTPVPGAKQLFPDAAGGVLAVRFETPGSYQIVARAQKLSAFSPWTPPAAVRAKGPFDFKSQPRLVDSRGSSIRLRGELGERSAKGRVRIAIARGKRGKRFRSLGRATIRRGVITKRFSPGGRGSYRLRYRYKGNASVFGGTIYQGLTTF